MASNSEAISSSGGTPLFCRPLMSVSAKTPHFPATGCSFDPYVAHVAELFGRNAQLGVDLVDDRARAAGALIVHRGDLLLAAGLRIFLEDDDLGVLAAQFDHRAALGIELLDGQRDGVHFLHELGADQGSDAAAAAAR